MMQTITISDCNKPRRLFPYRHHSPNLGKMLSYVILCAIILTGTLFPKLGHSARNATATATFAGGCFWCMEQPFDDLDGVISTTSGYTGGNLKNPTYEQVSAGGTGHAEAVQIVYDPARISYATLLDVFWRNIDPLARDRQFCDVGNQYRSAVFYHNADQKKSAETSLLSLEKTRGWKIATEIVPAGPFYLAEEYHQDYYRKNPLRYKFYRGSCGRDKRLKELWGEKKK